MVISFHVPQCEPFSHLQSALWHGRRVRPPCEHDGPLFHAGHCHDAWPLHRDGGRHAYDVQMPSYGDQLLSSTCDILSVWGVIPFITVSNVPAIIRLLAMELNTLMAISSLYSNYSLSEGSETGRHCPCGVAAASRRACSIRPEIRLIFLNCDAERARTTADSIDMKRFPVGVYSAAACASWLTTDSAILVRASSVASSSSSVSSSSETASSSPNSSAHVRSVPYREIS